MQSAHLQRIMGTGIALRIYLGHFRKRKCTARQKERTPD